MGEEIVGALAFMAPALAACLILTGIHAYLGIHILDRGVIFVDLALAQIAALGGLLAAFFHAHAGGIEAYFLALGLTMVGAVVFTFTRSIRSAVPQEAFIGIAYAVASALAVLIASQFPHETHGIREMMTGSILVVTWLDIAKVSALYAGVGLIHWKWRKRFLQISMQPEEAAQSGVSVRWWDFLFYALFGVVVTSSVLIAGVLLVFSFLIAPAIAGSLMGKSLTGRLIIGWIFGTAASFIGCALSLIFDLPTGPTVVCVCGFGLIAALFGRK